MPHMCTTQLHANGTVVCSQPDDCIHIANMQNTWTMKVNSGAAELLLTLTDLVYV